MTEEELAQRLPSPHSRPPEAPRSSAGRERASWWGLVSRVATGHRPEQGPGRKGRCPTPGNQISGTERVHQTEGGREGAGSCQRLVRPGRRPVSPSARGDSFLISVWLVSRLLCFDSGRRSLDTCSTQQERQEESANARRLCPCGAQPRLLCSRNVPEAAGAGLRAQQPWGHAGWDEQCA